ncbi:MAG: hypothetical protein AB1508_19025 [Pseudomonadota bacterium]
MSKPKHELPAMPSQSDELNDLPSVRTTPEPDTGARRVSPEPEPDLHAAATTERPDAAERREPPADEPDNLVQDSDTQPDVKSPEEPEDAASDETPAEPDVSLVAELAELGVSKETAQAMNPKQRHEIITAFDRRLLSGSLRPGAPGNGKSAAPEPAPAPAASAPLASPAAQPPSEFRLDLDEELVDPNIVKPLRSLHEHHNRALATFKEQTAQVLKAVIEHIQALGNSIAEKEFDEALQGLDDELFGTERTADLSPQAPAFQNRSQLRDTMMQLVENLKAVGIKPPPRRDLLRRAYYIQFADRAVARAENKVRNELRQQLRDQQGRFVSRPSHRDEPALPRDERAVAIQNLRERMRAKGMLE